MKKLIVCLLAMFFVCGIGNCQIAKRKGYIISNDIETISAFNDAVEYTEIIKQLKSRIEILEKQLNEFMQIKELKKNRYSVDEVVADMKKSAEPSIYLNDKGEEISVIEKRKDKEGYVWLKVLYKNTEIAHWIKEVDLKLIELKTY